MAAFMLESCRSGSGVADLALAQRIRHGSDGSGRGAVDPSQGYLDPASRVATYGWTCWACLWFFCFLYLIYRGGHFNCVSKSSIYRDLLAAVG
jgi:hypothetical protein